MHGQWMGSIGGTYPATALVDIDDRGDRFTGFAFFKPNAPGEICTAVYFDTKRKAAEYDFEAPIQAIDPQDCRALTHDEFKIRFPDGKHDMNARIVLKPDNSELFVSYSTGISSGDGVLKIYPVAKVSNRTPDHVMSWTEFKSYIDRRPDGEWLFRGQEAPWPLQSKFHRTGRSDLHRYCVEDVPHIQRHLTSHSPVFLSLDNPLKTSALYNLAQHYGFPTPILDWTYSPFVAAFFAFRFEPEVKEHSAVRLFAFNQQNWFQARNLVMLTNAGPLIEIMSLPPVENQRALPQQAVGMATTVRNIEHYLKFHEVRNGRKTLSIIDIPRTERQNVLSDLRMMGITAASLFPGLDGMFEELKNKLFVETGSPAATPIIQGDIGGAVLER